MGSASHGIFFGKVGNYSWRKICIYQRGYYLCPINSPTTGTATCKIGDQKMTQITTLSEVSFQDNVIRISKSQAVETAANRFFHELFNRDKDATVSRLFEEDGETVYEASQEGANEKLYIVKK